MANVPRTSPASDRIGVDQQACRPWARARGRKDPGHRGSDATSDTITWVFRQAASPQGPVSWSMGEGEGAKGSRAPRVRRNVRHDHLGLPAGRLPAGSGLMVYGRPFDGIVEAGREVGGRGVLKSGAGRIDQIDAAVSLARAVLDTAAERVQDIGERTARSDHLEQPLLFREQRLSPFAIVNVGTGAVPPDDPAGFVAKWPGADEKPAIDAVMPPQARLDLVRLSGRQHRQPSFHQGRQVLRMKGGLPAPPMRLLRGRPGYSCPPLP